MNRNGAQIAGIVVSLLVISIVHYAASASEMAWHEVFQRAYYLPIVVSALWYGMRGGLQVAALAAVLFLPHVIARSHGFPSYEFNQVSEAFLFFVFGGLAGVLSDQQKRQRDQLKKTAQRLSEVNADLQKSFESLRRAERLSALGRLSAGLAHEIRNPLSVISGSLEILGRTNLEIGQREEFMGYIKDEITRLNTMLTHFLEFARPRPPELQSTDARRFMEEVGGFISELVASRNLKTHCVFPTFACEVSVDANQMKEVILNLVLNASEAMPQGGAIHLWANVEDGYLAIHIKDEGTGIPEKDLAHIFDPFFTTKSEGTGLGLSIVHEIMEQHGGRIEAKRNPNHGMTFSLFFPHARFETFKPRNGENP